MVVEDVLDDRQAEPGAAHLARAGGVDPVKSLGQPWQVLARYALALIAHGYRHRRIFGTAASAGRPQPGRGPDVDFGSGAPVFDRVVDEVLEDLGQFVAIAEHVGEVGRQRKPDVHAPLTRAQLQGLGGLAQ